MLGDFFKVKIDAQTKKTVVSGYCIDLFLASFNALNQHVQFEFIPFTNESESESGKEFDAAVNDITITANRTLYADFTLPFTDIGLGIPSKNADTSMWIFMKPLSSDLWIVSACFFILLGFIIWMLEHQTNEEFQGSPVQQIGTAFWFAFSTIVYAHRQNLQSNLSRFVVTGALVRNLDFEDTRLKPYYTLEAYADALSRGSKKGGVDAIVAEIPYIKEFLAHYPSGYSMAVSEDITNSFGFAFSLGSPLVPKISRQIAKLREDGTLKALEDKWLNPQSNDFAPSPKVLNFKGLRGLFLISGASMAAALFLFMLYCIHKKLHFTYAMLAEGKLAFIIKLLMIKAANAVERG
nr:hypothetical protein [Tanacetum cinerariifolium]